MATPFDNLSAAKYVNLETFRRDGRAVRTPVWIGGRDGKLYAFSKADAGKVKRVRGQGRVRLAPCTMGGRITGEWAEGQAVQITRGDQTARARALLKAKYGLFGWITFSLFASRDRAGIRAYLEITLDES